MGCLPNCHDRIRIGGPPCEFEGLSHEVSQDVTGIRELIASYVNLCWVIGQFIASGVLVGVQPRLDVWGWKIPFAVQWVRPPFLLPSFYTDLADLAHSHHLCVHLLPRVPYVA